MGPGFTPPITRGGRSAIVPPPPHTYAVDYIAAYVRVDPAEAENLLPPELKLADDVAWIYISEFVSVSGDQWDLLYQDPEYTQYREGAIAFKVALNGNTYLYFPFMWVDRDWALMRGYVNGYPKKLARIAMSRTHPLLPGYEEPREGIRMGGYVARGGDVLYRLVVTLRERADRVPLADFGPTLTLRRFPATGEGEADVYEYVTVVRTSGRTSDVWRGDAQVDIAGGINDELGYVKVREVLGGYFYRSHFRIEGTKLVYRR